MYLQCGCLLFVLIMAASGIGYLVIRFQIPAAPAAAAAPAQAAASMEVPPSSTTTEEPGIVPTDKIYKSCNLSNGKIDCKDKGLDAFFTEADWAGLTGKVIKEMDLSGNIFTNITSIPELPIKVLNLSRCGIVNIETAAFRELQEMQVLDLSHNKLTSVNLKAHVFQGRYSPEYFEPLLSMRTLDLSYNDLHSLNQYLFEHLPELTVLILSNNPFFIIDHPTVLTITSLPSLQVLKMRSCLLSEIPERFLHTPRDLKMLDLSDNELTAVPQELEEAKRLTFLNLNQNPIEMIEKDNEDFPAFPMMPRLEELHMCNMDQLVSVGEYAMGGLTNLKILHLSNNPKLTNIAPKALARVDKVGDSYVWPPVQQLYISGNNLTQLDSRLVSRWDRLTELEASDNPYSCDCATQWMVDVLGPIADKLKANSSQNFVCAAPDEMIGKNMQHLNSINHTMSCLDKDNHRSERNGALLLGSVIGGGVVLGVLVVLSILVLWSRGYFALCSAFDPASFTRPLYIRARTEEVKVQMALPSPHVPIKISKF